MSATSSAANGSRAARGRSTDRQPEIYGHKRTRGEQSINFVTCHDGFTLNDLVSYNEKHNEANGEEQPRRRKRQSKLELRREGPTDDPAIEKLRNRQIKNFLTVTICRWACPCS